MAKVLETFEVELGFEPLGHKAEEGDGRTPEGDYIVDRRNPNSEFYLSIGIDYPNEADIAAAEEAGVDPGGTSSSTARRGPLHGSMTGPPAASP
jgi:murein L,D-transpeptidase YafK